MKGILLGVLLFLLYNIIEDYIKDRKATKALAKRKPVGRSEGGTELQHPFLNTIDFAGAKEKYKESRKNPPKIMCSVCDKEISKEEIRKGKAYINYMVEGIGIDNMYFHKRCMNNNVLVDKNP